MRNKSLRIVLTLLGVAAIVCLGGFREFVFVNINYHLKFLYYEQSQSYAHSFFDFLNNYTYNQVYYSKWALTVVFSVVFLLNSLLIIKVLFGKKEFLKWTAILYGVLFLLSAIAFGIGWLLGSTADGYTVARLFMALHNLPFR